MCYVRKRDQLISLDKVAEAIKEADNSEDINEPSFYHGIAVVAYNIADQLEPNGRKAFLEGCGIDDYKTDDEC